MIDYLRKQEDGLLVRAQDGRIDILDEPVTRILNQIALASLSSLDARIRATKKVFHLQSRVPIWLKEEVLFIPLYGIRSEKMCLVNYFAVRSIVKNKARSITLLFRDGLTLTDVPAALFQNRLDVCERIIHHMNAQ